MKGNLKEFRIQKKVQWLSRYAERTKGFPESK